MSGEGVLPVASPIPDQISRDQVVRSLEARAAAVEAAVDPDKLQAHSRLLPTEAEQDRARYAARQLPIAADDFRAGLEASPADPEEID